MIMQSSAMFGLLFLGSNVCLQAKGPSRSRDEIEASDRQVWRTGEYDRDGPVGSDTNRSSNTVFQPKKFTSHDRDTNGSDEAMFQRYNRCQSL